jgi:hypothetical protein
MSKTMSLKPSDMVTGGGGILNGTNIRLDKVKFGMLKYKNEAYEPVPAFMVEYTDTDTGDNCTEDGAPYDQGWKVAVRGGTYLTPSKDGKAMNTDGELLSSCNFGMLLASLANAIGEDELNEHLEDDITILEGLECRVVQVPDKRPTARKRKDKKTGKEYDATVPVIDIVHKLPWDKGSKSTTKASDVDVEKITADKAREVLAKSGGELAQNLLMVGVFQALAPEYDEKVATAAATLIQDPKFLEGIDGVTFKDGVAKLG